MNLAGYIFVENNFKYQIVQANGISGKPGGFHAFFQEMCSKTNILHHWFVYFSFLWKLPLCI